MIPGYSDTGKTPAMPRLRASLFLPGITQEWAVIDFIVDTGAATTCDALRIQEAQEEVPAARCAAEEVGGEGEGIVPLPDVPHGRASAVGERLVGEVVRPREPARLSREAVQLDEELGVAGQAVALTGVLAHVAAGEGRLPGGHCRRQEASVAQHLGRLNIEQPHSGGAVAPLALARPIARAPVKEVPPVQSATVGLGVARQGRGHLARDARLARLPGGLVDAQQEVPDAADAVGEAEQDAPRRRAAGGQAPGPVAALVVPRGARV